MNDHGPGESVDDRAIVPSAGDDITWLAPEGPGAEAGEIEFEAVTLTCWRCGKTVGAAYPSCPFCRARLAADVANTRGSRPRAGRDAEADRESRRLPPCFISTWPS